MRILDVKPTNKPEPVSIPAHGYYVNMNYVYGDSYGHTTVTAGPVPVNDKPMLIELLNILEQMLRLYENGRACRNAYEDIPGYELYFDERPGTSITPEQDARDLLGLETALIPDGSGRAAKLTSYTVYFQDGVTTTRYPMTLVTD